MMKIYFFFSVLLIGFLSCSNSQQPNDPIPNHETFTIDSKYVNEKRVITVWFPDEYKNSTDSLPVLYMLDGGIKEDFPHIANTLSELIKLSDSDVVILRLCCLGSLLASMSSVFELESRLSVALLGQGVVYLSN